MDINANHSHSAQIDAFVVGNAMKTIVLTLVLAAPLTAKTSDVLDLVEKKCERKLELAISTSEEDRRLGLIMDVIRLLSHYQVSVSSEERHQIAVLADILLRTSQSWDTRFPLVYLFRDELCDRESRLAFTYMAEILELAKAVDAERAALPRLNAPDDTFAGVVAYAIEKMKNVAPGDHAKTKPKPK